MWDVDGARGQVVVESGGGPVVDLATQLNVGGDELLGGVTKVERGEPNGDNREQAGRHQQCRRQRHLDDDERIVTIANAPGRRAGALLHRLGGIGLGRTERGPRAGDEDRPNRCGEREREDAPARNRHQVANLRHRRNREVRQNVQRPPCEKNA